MPERRPDRAACAAVVLAIALVAPTLGQDDEHPTCRPHPDAEARLEELYWETIGCEPLRQPCWREKLAALRELRERFPRDLHVHRAYQNAMPAGDREQMVQEYRELADRHPDDPLFLYLLARRLRGEELTATAERALAAAPDYPWAHLVRLVAYLGAEPPRPEAAFEHLETFMRLCPENIAPVLAYAGRLGEPEYWRERLPGLRRRLGEASVPDQLQSTSWLWTLEFQLRPPTEHEQVRERVREDLERLARLEVAAEAPLLRLLASGWELVGDAERLAEVRARQGAVDACAFEVVNRTLEAWAEARGMEVAARELTPELARGLYHATSGWLETCPESYPYWSTRMRAVAELDELGADALLADIDRYLEIWEREKGRIGTWSSPYRESAELLLERGIALERLPALIEQERAYVRGRRAGRGEPPAAMKAQIEESELLRDFEIDLLATRADIALGDLDAAAAALDRLETRIAELARMPGLGRMSAPAQHPSLLALRAELALAEDRRPDAIAYWRQAAAQFPASVRGRTDYEQRALELWQELGGTAEAFALLAAGEEMPQAAVEMGVWSEVAKPLAPFELLDLEGRTWTPDDLAGQTVLINVWATWCGPCRVELPYLARLEETAEELEGLRILTFNVDRNPGLIVPYLEREGLEFDVLLAERHVLDEQSGRLSIPQNWIVDPQGTIRREQSGFSAEAAELWLGEALRQMKAVHAGAETAAGD